MPRAFASNVQRERARLFEPPNPILCLTVCVPCLVQWDLVEVQDSFQFLQQRTAAWGAAEAARCMPRLLQLLCIQPCLVASPL